LQTQHIEMLYTWEYKYTGSKGRQWAGWMELLLEFGSLSILWKVYILQSEVVHIWQSDDTSTNCVSCLEASPETGKRLLSKGSSKALTFFQNVEKSATESVWVKDVVKTWKPGSYWLACHQLWQSPAQTILSKKHSTKDGRRQS
jgi:hypothetical protein